MNGKSLSALLSVISGCALAADLPSSFDLRNVGGQKWVSAVKKQSGGTCWTHGTMAAIESNLLVTGTWASSGEEGDANLAEYHLDWWNGFNRHYNGDIAPKSSGLTVHEGGDYRVAAAYLARGGGVVRDVDAQSYQQAPKDGSDSYHYFYVRDIEWLSAGKQNENIDRIKAIIKENGAIGTALAWNNQFYSSSNATFYQPANDSNDPNHAVSIVGWDDAKKTQAPKPGAWLVKNSWGTSWGSGGYFWISYYDKVAAHHDQMGAVSFRNVEPLSYDRIYYHDYHGWRDTKTKASEAFNAFVAEGKDALKSVSFITAAENVSFEVKVFGKFENGELSEELSSLEGSMENVGLHTVDLSRGVSLTEGQRFYVYVKLSDGGHAFDRTSNVPVLLGGGGRPTVESAASAGESYYRTESGWRDLTEDDASANFCIKALAVSE